MAKKPTAKKRITGIIATFVVMVLALTMVLCSCGKNDDKKQPVAGNADDLKFTLSEHDVALTVGETLQLKLVSIVDGEDVTDQQVQWVSEMPSVAKVGDDGTVTAVAGGETVVRAIVDLDEKQYNLSCVVTVKTPDRKYSTYKVRYFTQRHDRSGYDATEETFEREIGSKVSMTLAQARKRLPGNYVLNAKKCVLTGEVKEQLGMCILEVYYDVAQITYYVDCYYESATALGTYATKETTPYKAYAFTEVNVASSPKEGFVLNATAPGSILSNSSVTDGMHLIAYFDRARADVTVTYASGKKSVSYKAAYGVGLLNAPSTVLEDSIDPFGIAWMVNGKQVANPSAALKKVTGKTTVESKLDGKAFNYNSKDGSIVNATTAKNQSAYAYLKGSGKTVWLSSKWTTTGSQTNMFGITIQSGGQNRQIRFNQYGVAIMRDNIYSSGILDLANKGKYANAYIYDNPGMKSNGRGSVWAQSNHEQGGIWKKSAVYKMMREDKLGSVNEIEWAIYEGTLYYMVNGDVSGAVDLSLLCEKWTADAKYQIGFTTWDGMDIADPLKISNIQVKFNDDALSELVTTGKVNDATTINNMHWEPFTGSYLQASQGGGATIGKSGETVGVSADLEWMDWVNTASSVGVTVKIGDKSVEFMAEGKNTVFRRMANRSWSGIVGVTSKQITDHAKDGLFDNNGKGNISAYVKDGYFYMFYNHKEVYCINLLSLFPDYKPGTKAELGIFTWDGYNGLVHIRNLDFKNADEVTAQTDDTLKQWGYYVPEKEYINDYANYTYQDDTFKQVDEKRSFANLFGSSKVWQIDGKIKREKFAGATSTGLIITSENGAKSTTVYAGNQGFYLQCSAPNFNFLKPSNKNNIKYVFNSDIQAFAAEGEAATRMEMQFRFVIINDTLYCWEDSKASPGKLELAFRLPLTEDTFGGHAEGSEYSVKLAIDGTNTTKMTGNLSITNLQVKMGYQVTDQEDFFTVGETKYTVDDTVKKIENNLKKWKSGSAHTALSGQFAEDLVNFDFANDGDAKGATHAQLVGEASDAIYLSGTYSAMADNGKANSMTGFSIKDQAGVGRSVMLYKNGGLRFAYGNGINTSWADLIAYKDIPAYSGFPLEDPEGPAGKGTITNSFSSFPSSKNHYIWAPKTTEKENETSIKKFLSAAYGVETKIEVAIINGLMNIRIGGEIAAQIPMSSLYAGWSDTSTKYEISFLGWDVDLTCGHRIKDAKLLTGDAAREELDITGIVEEAEVQNMAYESFTGTYAPTLATENNAGMSYLLGESVKGNQSLDMHVTLEATGSGSANGFIVKSENDVFYLLADGSGKVRVPGAPITAFEGSESDMSAVVKDDTLYVSYNGTPAFSLKLEEILKGYKKGDALQLGAASYQPGKGLARFSNFTYKTGEQTPEVPSEGYEPINSKMHYAFPVNNNATVDRDNKTLTFNPGGEVEFLDSGKTWEISGTLERDNSVEENKTKNSTIGFDIYESGKKSGVHTRVTINKAGFYLGVAGKNNYEYMNGRYFLDKDGTANRPQTGVANRKYHYRYDMLSFCGFVYSGWKDNDPYDFPSTRNTMNYKLVIYDDVLYGWFNDGTSSELQLNFALPLTEAEFGAFAKGTNYSVVLVTDGNLAVKSTGTNVLIDEEVTDNKKFFTIDDKDYSVADAAAAIKANVNRWKDYNQQHMIFSGALAQNIEEYRIDSYTQTNWAIPVDLNENQYVKATWKRLPSAVAKAFCFGFIIKDKSGNVRQVITHNKAISLQGNGWTNAGISGLFTDGLATTNTDGMYKHNEVGKPKNHYVWGQDATNSSETNKIYSVMERLKNKDASAEIDAAIVDNTLYIRFDGYVAVRMPLTYLSDQWVDGTEYKLGFSVFGPNDCKGFRLTKIETASGQAALDKLHEEKKVEGAELHNMFFEAFDGTYAGSQSAETKDVITYMLGQAVTGDQSLSMVVKPELENFKSANGFAIKAGNKIVYILADKEGNVRIATAEDVAKEGLLEKTDFVVNTMLGTSFTPYNGVEKTNMTATLKAGKLYISLNGKAAFAVELNSILSTYGEGVSVKIGPATYAPGKGLARFSELTYTTGEAVTVTDTEYTDRTIKVMMQAEDAKTTVNAADATAEQKDKGNVLFFDSSNTWVIEGTMHHTNNGTVRSFGFVMTDDSGKTTSMYICGDGFYLSGGNSGTKVPKADNRHYLFSNTIATFANNPATRQQMNYRFVIYKDTVLCWIENDSTKKMELAFRCPLTDAEFGSHAAGGTYTVKFRFDQNAGQSCTDMKVTKGAAAEKIANFITHDSKDYTLDEAYTTITSNVDRWSKMDNNHVIIRGVLAEGIQNVNVQAFGGRSYAHIGKVLAKDIYLTSTYERYAKGAKAYDTAFGLCIEDSKGNSRNVYFARNGFIFYLADWGTTKNDKGVKIPALKNGATNDMYDFQFSGSKANIYTWDDQATGAGRDTVSLIGKFTTIAQYPIGTKHPVVWVITGNTLYIQLSGTVIGRIPLKDLCPDWTDDAATEFSVGFSSWSAMDGGGHYISDISLLTGEEALAKLKSNAEIKDAELKNMAFEPITGSYAGLQAKEYRDAITHLLGKEVAGNQSLTMNVKLDAGDKSASLNGFAVKADGKTAYVLVDKDGKIYQVPQNEAESGTFDVAEKGKPSPVTVFKDSNAKMSAVIKDGKLYVSFNEQPAFYVDMSTLIEGYTTEKNVQLGFATYAPGKGLARFSSITHTEAEDLTEFTGEGYNVLADASPIANRLARVAVEVAQSVSEKLSALKKLFKK